MYNRVFARGFSVVAEGGVGKGVLATSATGHDAFAQIANANAGFWYCPALSLCVYGFFGLTANISWLTGRHSLFATPPPLHGHSSSPCCVSVLSCAAYRVWAEYLLNAKRVKSLC